MRAIEIFDALQVNEHELIPSPAHIQKQCATCFAPNRIPSLLAVVSCQQVAHTFAEPAGTCCWPHTTINKDFALMRAIEIFDSVQVNEHELIPSPAHIQKQCAACFAPNRIPSLLAVVSCQQVAHTFAEPAGTCCWPHTTVNKDFAFMRAIEIFGSLQVNEHELIPSPAHIQKQCATCFAPNRIPSLSHASRWLILLQSPLERVAGPTPQSTKTLP